MRRVRRILAALIAAGALAGASPAVAVPPQELIGHLTNYMNARGHEVGPVPSLSKAAPDGTYHYYHYTWVMDGGALAIALPGAIVWSHNGWADLVRVADSYGVWGTLPAGDVDDLNAALHEILHQRGLYDGWYDSRGDIQVAGLTMRWWEEGITEAVARDVLGPAAKALFGYTVNAADLDYTTYADRVRSVRQLSVYATWPGTWKDAEATAWRAALIRQNYDGRAASLRWAYAMKEAVS